MFNLKQFLYNERGQLGAGVAISIVVLLASLAIGALIFTQIFNQAEEQVDNTSDDYTQMQDIKDTGWSALVMLALAAFVGAAVVIIALLRQAGGGGGGF